MTEGGWHPVWRKLYDSAHWLAPTKRDPASRRDAWIDLCQMATHQPRRVGGTDIVLGRAELICSLRTLGDRWKWSKTKVQRFMSDLEMRSSIATVRETVSGTVYRVVNYDDYAVSRDSEWDSERNPERDTRGTPAGQEQEGVSLQPPIVPLREKRRTSLPDDWQPNDRHRERARAERVDCDREAEKFRAHHLAKGSLMKSWDQAFTTWLLKAGEYAGGGRNGTAADDGHWADSL